KVLNVDSSRRHIDLSLKDVNAHQKRAKIQDWKNEQKGTKWLQFVAEETKTDNNTMQNIYETILDKFGSVYLAFEDAAMNGIDSFKNINISDEVVQSIVNIAQDNIKLPFVDIAGYVDLTSDKPNGIEIIKKALKAASKVKRDEVKVNISYVGAPRYRIKVIAPDYKTAEGILKKSSKAAIDVIEKAEGKGIFHRHIESINA
ncbi:MAG: translation initiation factor IF-2 subunit alpha, partial [Methanosarcinaceae archaeon]